jgi:hypothetical protein
MFFNTIKTICISLLLIALIHYLYSFFKDTLTVPKIKDLVNKPAKRYDEMFDILSNSKRQGVEHIQSESMLESSNIQRESIQSETMQEELKNFLNELKKPNENKFNNKNIDFSGANDMMSGQYSPF